MSARSNHGGLRVMLLDSYARAFFGFRKDLLADLVSRGFEVVAAAPDDEDGISARLREVGVRYERFRFHRERNGFSALAVLFWNLIILMRHVRPDVVILYSPRVVIFGAVAAFLAGVPRRYAVVTGLGYGFVSKTIRGRLLALSLSLMYSVALRLCGFVLFQNQDDLDSFMRRGVVPSSRSAAVRGSGVDLDTFAFRHVATGAPFFLMASRLLVSKGVRDFIRAATELKRSYPDARFQLAGWHQKDSPDCVSDQEFADLVEMPEVEYLGSLSDVGSAIGQCAVFVLPSYYREGTPRSILEAMAVGRAIVTTNMPGCRETVIDGENGFVIPPRAPSALAEAMKAYIIDPGLAARHGLRSRKLAEQLYDVRKVNAYMLSKFRLADAAGPSGDSR